MIDLLKMAIRKGLSELSIQSESGEIQVSDQLVEKIAKEFLLGVESLALADDAYSRPETLRIENSLLKAELQIRRQQVEQMEKEKKLHAHLLAENKRQTEEFKKLLEDCVRELDCRKERDAKAAKIEGCSPDKTSIRTLGLSDEVTQNLEYANIRWVDDLAKLSALQLLEVYGLTTKDMEWILYKLHQMGLTLADTDQDRQALLTAAHKLSIDKLVCDIGLTSDETSVSWLLKHYDIHTIGSLAELSSLELLLLDPSIREDTVDRIQDILEDYGLQLVEDNFFNDESLSEMAHDVPIEKLFPDKQECLQALRDHGIETINKLLTLTEENLFELLEDDRPIILEILKRLTRKGFQLCETEHILGLPISKFCGRWFTDWLFEEALEDLEIQTVGELICYRANDFPSKCYHSLSKAQVNILRYALLEEGLHLYGGEKWARNQRPLRDMSPAEIRNLPTSRLLFTRSAKRAMGTLGIGNIGTLLDYSEDELRQQHGIGDETVDIVIDQLKNFGLKLKVEV